MATIEGVEVYTPEDFQLSLHVREKPCVIRGFDVGLAPSLWTAEYLARQCGEVSVKAHVCPVEQMNFVEKNFSYR